MNELFDPSLKYFAYRENYYRWGDGPIYDRFGKIIAKYHLNYRPLIIEFKDLENKILFSLIKTKKMRNAFNIRDENNAIKGTVRKKISSLNVLDLNRKKILKAYIGDFGADFEILNNRRHLIALIQNTANWREIFNEVMFEFGDIKGIEICDFSIDRKFIISLLMIMEFCYRKKYINFIVGPPVPI